MAYIWELPGWNSGAKVRRSSWHKRDYTQKLNGKWYNEVRITAVDYDDWELFVEPPVEAEVFEWMYLTTPGCWSINDLLMTEAEAAKYFDGYGEYRKTGRSFKVPVTK